MGKKSHKALPHAISIKMAAIGFAGLLVISVIISFMIFVSINQNKPVINQAPDTQTETNYDNVYKDSIADSGSSKTADDERAEDDITKKLPETNNSSDTNASGANGSNSQGFNNGTTDGIFIPNCSENPNLIAPPKGECKYIIENGRSVTVYLNNLIADNKRFLKVTSSNSNVAFISGGNRISESSLVTNHLFKMVIRNEGKADIIFSELNDETRVAVMHVEMRVVIRPVSSLSVVCPDRKILYSGDIDKWEYLAYTYLPVNATTIDKTTVSVAPIGYIELKNDNGVLYVKPLKIITDEDSIPPITIKVTNESVSTSCTF